MLIDHAWLGRSMTALKKLLRRNRMPDELVKMFLEQVIDSMAEFYLHYWEPSTTFDGENIHGLP